MSDQHLAPHADHSIDVPFSRPSTPGGSRHGENHQIGWVGLGAMGYFMARNLAINRQSHPAGSPPVVVQNRTVAKAEKLVKEVGANRARVAQTPGEVARDCDIIITNLASDEAVRSIYQEFAQALTVSISRPVITHFS
jgi:3-hydroxyisobutyrate dehydrogenase-like beta-hydroxyacid dehydrogenase